MRITLYMLQEGAEFGKESLRDGSGFSPVDTTDIGSLPCKLYVKSGFVKPPKWVSYLNNVAADPHQLDPLRTQSSSAVLLVKHSEAIFALAFGNGFQAIDPSKMVRGFGLRVTANAVAKVKSADTRGLNREGKSQRVVMPVAGAVADMGIEFSEDWLRQLSGDAVSSDFATTAAGADSLRLSIKDFTLAQLSNKLTQVAAYHKSDDYKQRFAFIDNFIRLEPKDPVVAELTNEVADLIRNRSSDIFFAAPDPFEQADVDHYEIIRRKRITIGELTQEEVYTALDQVDFPADDPLHKIAIAAMNVDDEPIDKQYKLYDYIQAEIARTDARYVLSAGVWFRVSDDYAAEVKRRVAEIPDVTTSLNLPAWKKKSAGKWVIEAQYNADVATARKYALLDKDNLHFGQQQKVEVCDLLTPDKELICVKRATRSSTLSHLFAQGSVSAALMYRSDYKKKLTDGLAKIGAGTNWGSVGDWTVVYAIGTEKSGSLASSLFFFSQVNLLTHVDDIRGRSINVAIARIAC